MLDACEVWWARPVGTAEHPWLVAVLDAHERERLHRFRRPADRDRYLAAHALARLVLGRHLGCPPGDVRLDRTCRCGQQHGKPRLADTGTPHLSLTHSGDVVGLAVRAGGAVGLDVEQVRGLRDLAGMARHVWSATELARAERSGHGPVDACAFLTTWTRKEALLKATGDGLAVPMSAITVAAPDEPAALHSWTGDAAPDGPVWLHDLTPRPGYLAALAGPGAGVPAVTVTDGDGLLRAG